VVVHFEHLTPSLGRSSTKELQVRLAVVLSFSRVAGEVASSPKKDEFKDKSQPL